MSKSYMPKSKSDVHETPDRVYDIIEKEWGYTKDILHDPCPADTPHKSSIFFNGLYLPYSYTKINYINAPYARRQKEKNTELARFVFKSIAESYNGNISIMLCPVKTDQPWFHFLIAGKYEIIWIEKRLHFKNDLDSSMQSHFLVMIK